MDNHIRRRHHPRATSMSETIEAWIFFGAVVFTLLLVYSGTLTALFVHISEMALVTAFFAGVLFTSVLTFVPAMYGLVEASNYAPAWQIGLFGALGAVIGDLILFRLIRSSLTGHLLRAIFSPGVQHIGRTLSSGALWWTAPLFGFIAFASPLPDEIGLLMMGMSHLRPLHLVPLYFSAHFIGIFILASTVQIL